jgi:hypothetical protein
VADQDEPLGPIAVVPQASPQFRLAL